MSYRRVYLWHCNVCQARLTLNDFGAPPRWVRFFVCGIEKHACGSCAGRHRIHDGMHDPKAVEQEGPLDS